MRLKRTFANLAAIGAILLCGKGAEAGTVHLIDDSLPDSSYDVRADFFAADSGGYAGGYIQIDTADGGAGKLEIGAYAGPGDCQADPLFCASTVNISGYVTHRIEVDAREDFFLQSGAPADVLIPLDIFVYALVQGVGYSEARVDINNAAVVSATGNRRYQERTLDMSLPSGGALDVRLYALTRIAGGSSKVTADPVTVIDPNWEYANFSDLIDINDTFPPSITQQFGDPLPSPVPLPAAAWLFGTALIGLLGFGKRSKAA